MESRGVVGILDPVRYKCSTTLSLGKKKSFVLLVLGAGVEVVVVVVCDDAFS